MVRMKDIAKDLGVSVVTVSRALRNYPDIRPVTRAQILKRAEELKYSPNLAARALVTGRSSLMGLVVPDLLHTFFAELAVGLSGVCAEVASAWSFLRQKKTRNWSGKRLSICSPGAWTPC